MKHGKQESGFALVAVLCWSMLLALAAGAIVTISKTQADDAAEEMKAAQLAAIADAGLRLTILALASPDGVDRLNVAGVPFTIHFAETDIVMSVSDEDGKVDLNAAPFPLLLRLFHAFGQSPEVATAQANRVLDWREQGDLKRLNGAKQDDYRRLGYAYGPRQAAFHSVGEIRLVMGIDDALFAQIEPSLTVLSQQSEIDWSVVGKASSLLMRPASSVTGSTSDLGLGAGSQLPPPQRIFGRAFLLRAEARAGSYAVIRTAAIRITGSPRAPVSIYYWK